MTSPAPADATIRPQLADHHDDQRPRVLAGLLRRRLQDGVARGQPDSLQQGGRHVFHAGKFAARQVEPRNTPTTINAAFFQRNFWDGRANNLFNGVGVFGMRDINGDPNKRLIVLDANNHAAARLPAGRECEPGLAGRRPAAERAGDVLRSAAPLPTSGRKLLFTIPLLPQKVAKTDSVLGPLRQRQRPAASSCKYMLRGADHEGVRPEVLGVRRAATRSSMAQLDERPAPATRRWRRTSPCSGASRSCSTSSRWYPTRASRYDARGGATQTNWCPRDIRSSRSYVCKVAQRRRG